MWQLYVCQWQRQMSDARVSWCHVATAISSCTHILQGATRLLWSEDKEGSSSDGRERPDKHLRSGPAANGSASQSAASHQEATTSGPSTRLAEHSRRRMPLDQGLVLWLSWWHNHSTQARECACTQIDPSSLGNVFSACSGGPSAASGGADTSDGGAEPANAQRSRGQGGHGPKQLCLMLPLQCIRRPCQ